MTTTTRLAAGIAGLTLTALTAVCAPPAMADEVIAQDPAASVSTIASNVPTARASRPRQITVTNHGGRSVTLFAKGERIRRVLAPGARPAVFSGLTAGRVYTVAVGSEPIGTVVALDAPAAAAGLVVRSTRTPGTVTLTWRHPATAATGGRTIAYDITARSGTAPAVTTSVIGTRTTTLSGLSTDAAYTFSVVPRNSVGRGRATTAAMTRPLGGTPATVAPVVETPAPVVEAPRTPAPAPVTPAPAPGPTTRTIQRCPSGFTELASGLCQKATPYTVTTKAYTYTWGVVGSHSVPDDYAANVGPLAQGPVCPWGGYYVDPGICRGATSHSVDDYGWIKDAAPTGYTDDGTQWTKRDPIPAGYTDDGTQWVLVVPKETVVVPA